MDWQIIFTLALVALALTAMVRELAAPDLVLMATLICFGATGVLSPIETFAGFANPVVAAIGALFIVSAALRETGALEMTLGRVLGRFTGTRRSMLRMTVPVAGLSAFLNNAPIVAMMTPTVIDWARRNQTARLAIPDPALLCLDPRQHHDGDRYEHDPDRRRSRRPSRAPPWRFFEPAPVGILIAAAGLLYLIFVAPARLPDRVDAPKSSTTEAANTPPRCV